MAEGLNRVMLLGNLGFDPELRYTKSGQAMLKIRLATSERYKDQTGEWKDRTEWHRVTVWGKRGEALAKFLTKGSSIFVEGALRTSSYEKEGQKHYSTEIIARDILLTGRGGAGGGARAASADQDAFPGASAEPSSQAAPAAEAFEGAFAGGADDDDIPF